MVPTSLASFFAEQRAASPQQGALLGLLTGGVASPVALSMRTHTMKEPASVCGAWHLEVERAAVPSLAYTQDELDPETSTF
jgi:hypothetical protein